MAVMLADVIANYLHFEPDTVICYDYSKMMEPLKE